MRVVSGVYGGRKLATFKGEDIRPTLDKIRESVFNILRDKIFGAKFLDLFCGTGAMGIEAISRGAKGYFNDVSRESLKVLNTNLKNLKIENADIKNLDAISYIKVAKEKFDIVYLDPPYKSELGIDALKIIDGILTENGIVIYENEKPFCEETEIIEKLEKYDERKYGRAYVTFFKVKK